MSSTVSSLSFSPWEGSLVILRVDAPEELVDQLEKEADEQTLHHPEMQRAAYKSEVRTQIGQLRAAIVDMRARGCQDHEIKNTFRGLKEQFYHSMSRFTAGGEQFSKAKEEVS